MLRRAWLAGVFVVLAGGPAWSQPVVVGPGIYPSYGVVSGRTSVSLSGSPLLGARKYSRSIGYDAAPCGCFGPPPFVSFVSSPVIYYQPVYINLAPGDPFGVGTVPPGTQPNVPPAGVQQPAQPRPAVGGPMIPLPQVPRARTELEQKTEFQRQLRAGNEAFAEGNYAQAVKAYQNAVSAAPLEAIGYFHLAQAHLAVGKPAEATAAIQRGLLLQPRWPALDFRPRDLYRERPADFDRHLAVLADLITKNINDDLLLFLLGYQLWFDGKQDEAGTLFRRAAALTLDTTHLDRFLKLAPDRVR